MAHYGKQINIEVTKQTMLEKDSSLKPAAVIKRPGEKYQKKNRKWQGIPSIERSNSGRLWYALYSGGENEGIENFVLVGISDDDGKTWSDPIIAIDHPGKVRAYDECLWFSPDGRMFLFWSQSYGGFDGRAGCFFSYCDTPDTDYYNWSTPVRIADGIMMNKPTVLSNGEWMLPIALWKYFDSDFNPNLPNRLSNVYVTVDGGKTFEYRGGADVPNRCFDEHMVVEKKDGTLWMLVRLIDGIGEAFSSDGGRTWKGARKTSLGGPNSRFFIRRLNSGNLFLVNHWSPTGKFNDVAETNPDFKVRSHLSAFLSQDDGKTWSKPLIIDERKHIAYPDATESPDGYIYIIYDRDRFKAGEILLAVITEDDILNGTLVSPKSRCKIIVDKLEN